MKGSISAPVASAPAIPAELLNLAPLQLPNRRTLRYLGDDVCVALDTLAPRDQTLLRRLYERLTGLLFTMADTSTSDEQKWEGIERWTALHGLDEIVDEAREVGRASQAQAPSEDLAKMIHDIRGGALSSLVGRLQMLGHLRKQPDALNAFFVQTRDHLKIMRNALVGLDDRRREADKAPRAHAMQLMVDKWHDSVVGPKWNERPIRMDVDCRYAGALTECCMESAAIDRIFYNLANNASRHTANDCLEMVIFPLPGDRGDCLRFVLSNAVGETDAARLRAIARADAPDTNLPDGTRDLPALFEPEISSTGSGFGLTVVADFVAGAFGLRDREVALRERYVGAVLDGQTFRVWFHWPTAHDNLPAKLDDYRHPEQSLSEP